MLVGLVAWIVSPIDLIPEFIPVLGPLDDVVVGIVAMRYVRRRVGIEDLRGALDGHAGRIRAADAPRGLRLTGGASGQAGR